MTAAKSKMAVASCNEHAKAYGVKIPDRVMTFWKSGEAFKYEGKCLRDGTELPTMESGSVRLATTNPSWDAQCENGGLDDAVVGPRGDWKAAKNYLPLFSNTGANGYAVVRLDDPKCPVGWFQEGGWNSKSSGYKDGVFMLAPSLDQFLAGLVPLDEAMWDDAVDFTWEGDGGDDDGNDDD